jgi:hypothetical protein
MFRETRKAENVNPVGHFIMHALSFFIFLHFFRFANLVFHSFAHLRKPTQPTCGAACLKQSSHAPQGLPDTQIYMMIHPTCAPV